MGRYKTHGDTVKIRNADFDPTNFNTPPKYERRRYPRWQNEAHLWLSGQAEPQTKHVHGYMNDGEHDGFVIAHLFVNKVAEVCSAVPSNVERLLPTSSEALWAAQCLMQIEAYPPDPTNPIAESIIVAGYELGATAVARRAKFL